ncbi:hypothetical protein PsalN5692_04122 (plasmid) [Piscirickettsia salmonis]|uniref:DUF4376 domain-containing protein n=1 Tax=Piscirickettsia salmonis TaxID=1238 RepID=UPI0012B8A9A3|nr:DUF4376 domain-containing protein [Piscirickettsia salmonis]QGP52613.1 hypothetical protein PsalN5692_04122 [Piscirickettsia salmonis]
MKEFIAHYDGDGEIIKFYVTANLPTYSKTPVTAPKENIDEEDEADLPEVYLSVDDVIYDTSLIPEPWLDISKEEHSNITQQPGKYIIQNDQVTLKLSGAALSQSLLATNIKEIKARRNLEISQAITYKDMQFDANEKSQFNIERSIRKWDSLTVLVNDRLGWILADNSAYDISLDELKALEDLITHRVELLYAYSGILEKQVTITQTAIDINAQNWDVLTREDEILAIIQGGA